MSAFLQDFRYGIRQLRKNPGFASTAILILALGMCGSIAIFGFVDAALIKPLPYANPNRLVEVTESVPMIPHAYLSYPNYLDWKKLNHVFSSMDVYNPTGYLLRTSTGSEPAPGIRVSDGFFHTLGVTPLLGRDFYSGEDLPSAPRTVMLSYAAWQKRFSGRKDVIGETVALSGIPYTIIGVLPRDFQFAPRGNAEFWTTLHVSDSCGLRRSCHNLKGIGRLKDGISTQTASADMKTIAAQLETQYPGDNRGQSAIVTPLSEVVVTNVRPILLALLGGSGLLLLIACVNVSSLLLVRTESRKREIAVRGALGASRARMIGQFISESMVLVAMGTLLGVAVAGGAMQLLLHLISKDMMAATPYLEGLGLNLHILIFAVCIAMFATALFSFAPLVRLPMTEMREGLSEGYRGSSGTLWRRFGGKMVVFELVLAVVLMVSAGLLGKSLYRLLHVDLGFQPDHLATLEIALPETSYGGQKSIAVGREIVRQARILPGVTSAAISNLLPVSFNGNTDWIRFVGRPYAGEHNEVNLRDVSAAYFTTLRARLLQGRYFGDDEDSSKPRVVIINEALARKYFPGQDPIGKKIGDNALTPKSIKEIIGVVDDLKEGSLDSEIWPAVYCPFNQSPDTYSSLVVRTAEAEQSMLPSLVNTVHQIDPDIGTLNEATMIGRISDSPMVYAQRSAAWLVSGFASLALILGAAGLYGVIAYLGQPANPRDRSAHGARGAAWLRLSTHHERSGVVDPCWNIRRPSLCNRRRNPDAGTAIRSPGMGRRNPCGGFFFVRSVGAIG